MSESLPVDAITVVLGKRLSMIKKNSRLHCHPVMFKRETTAENRAVNLERK